MLKHVKPSKKNRQAEEKVSPASLVVLAGPRFGETIALMKGKNVVGSDPIATIHFLTSLLSNHHFTLFYQDRRVVLTRVEGVILVNNVPVEETTLKDGDLIGAKGILLRYIQEGSREGFFVGDLFYGTQRRRYPRFNMIATADAFLPEKNLRIEVFSVRDISRGGAGLFCKEDVRPGTEISVSIYSKNPDRVIVAEKILGVVTRVALWNDSLFLLNVKFHLPVSSDYQPNLHERLIEMERHFSNQGDVGSKDSSSNKFF
jgi:hypothetical protein